MQRDLISDALGRLNRTPAEIVDRIETVIKIGGAKAAIDQMKQADDAEKRNKILRDRDLMDRIAWAFGTKEYQEIWLSWRMTLSDRLKVMLMGAGVGVPAICAMIAAAPEAERLAAHGDAKIMKSIDGYESPTALKLRLHLWFGSSARFNEKSPSVPAVTNATVYGIDAYMRDEKDWLKAVETLEDALAKAKVIDKASYAELKVKDSGTMTKIVLHRSAPSDVKPWTWEPTDKLFGSLTGGPRSSLGVKPSRAATRATSTRRSGTSTST